MNNFNPEILDFLLSLSFDDIINYNDDFIDIKVKGYSYNNYDNLIYPEFIVTLNTNNRHLNNLEKLVYSKVICSILTDNCSNFFIDILRILPSNIKITPKV